MKITRKTLYNMVWSDPRTKLAKELGISDVGLSKICKKHNIPAPPVGYWAKKRHGKPVRKKPLPKPKNNLEIEIREQRIFDGKKVFLDYPEVQEQFEKEVAQIRPVIIRESFCGSSQLVREARKELKDGVSDHSTGFIYSGRSPLSIKCTKSLQRRALLLMDALLRNFQQMGYEVSKGPTVCIFDETVSFRIYERYRHEPNPANIARGWPFGRIRYKPTGKLTLEIDSWGTSDFRLRKSWTDGKKQTLETAYKEIAIGILSIAAAKKVYSIREAAAKAERQRREATFAREAKERQRIREMQDAEACKVHALLESAINLNQSKQLRAFIQKAVQQRRSVTDLFDMSNSEFTTWVEWARQQADRLDPFTPSPPSILDQKVETEEQARGEFWGY